MNIKNMLRLVWQYVKLFPNFWYDLNRFYCGAASSAKNMSDEQLKARLLQRGHSIEKGLALPDVRGGFGVAPLKELRTLLGVYEARGLPRDNLAYLSARNAVAAYIQFHQSNGLTPPSEAAFISNLASPTLDVSLGGFVTVQAEEIKRGAAGDFDSLVAARHSTRMFASSIPDLGRIQQAINLAARSPSVCNRQGGRVRVVTNKALLKKILVLQGGNRGFTEEIQVALVVTCYVGLFRGARERNQCWIDGGLFAMSLLYGLAYVGLGACPLNWSADRKQDKKLREMLDLPEDEVVIMLVGVGDLRDEYRVATSARWSQDKTLVHVYS
jgi:nitroreductase